MGNSRRCSIRPNCASESRKVIFMRAPLRVECCLETLFYGHPGPLQNIFLRCCSIWEPQILAVDPDFCNSLRSQKTGVRRQESGDRSQESGVRRQERELQK